MKEPHVDFADLEESRSFLRSIMRRVLRYYRHTLLLDSSLEFRVLEQLHD